MSDAQPHTLLSSSPAPTDVSLLFIMELFCHTNLQTKAHYLGFTLKNTATEDVAESLSPDDGQIFFTAWHI